MVARKKFSEREIIETLYHSGILVGCYRCKTVLAPGELVEREHINELALGGEDAPSNCAYSHKGCHAIATNGTKATTAGSSKHKIAKVKRILGLTKNKPKKKIPSRKFNG